MVSAYSPIPARKSRTTSATARSIAVHRQYPPASEGSLQRRAWLLRHGASRTRTLAGHASRLNRPTLNESYRFGDLNYAKEELRAELASVFIAAEVGVPMIRRIMPLTSVRGSRL